ncbi:MAG: PilZ domain-containing protein [Clostridia bacterium]|nr:PilZ domain-containing protein [Clostridia bacterium]
MDITILAAIRPGDKLELFYVNSLNQDIVLETLVYDLESEDSILIHNPVKDGKLYMIPMNAKVNVTARRQDYGVIMFSMELIKRQKIGNVYTIQCLVVSDIKKQQRRSFYRVKVYQDAEMYVMVDQYMEPVKYYIFDPDAAEEVQVNMKVSLIDVSGGGVGIKAAVPMSEGTFVYIKLDFIEEDDYLIGQVVRSIESYQYQGEYEIGIKFIDLTPEVRRMLTSFVFARQQTTRRKEINDGKN